MEHWVYRVLAGEYAIPFLKFEGKPRVLDIGANVGSFSVWAQKEWPSCQLTAYEPQPQNCQYFKSNCPDIELIEKAVWPKEGKVPLYIGPLNPGQHSVAMKVSENSIEVETIHPKNLPDCDIMKIDTEGAEIQILSNYPHSPAVIMLEAHSEKDRRELEDTLWDDYCWIKGEIVAPNMVIMVFLNRKKVKVK
jgi:FkbM family methyltransferase